MSTTKYFLILMIGMLPNLLLAQSTCYIKLKPKAKEFAHQQFYVLNVIDKRVNKNLLGMVKEDGEMKKLQFRYPFEDQLHAAFLNIYPYKNSLIPVTVLVKDLRVVEHPIIDNQQKASVTMELDFLHSDTSIVLYNFKQTKIYEDFVPKTHKTIIEELLDISLLKTHEAILEKIAYKEIDTLFSTPLKFPIPKGLYPNFMDIIKGKSQAIPFTAVKRSGKIERFDLKCLDSDRKKIRRAFCMSDGKNIYINARAIVSAWVQEKPIAYVFSDLPWKKAHYLKVHFTGRFIYVEDRFTKGYYATIGGILGGGAGGLIGSAVGLKKKGVALDTENGSFHVLDRDYLKEVLDDYPDQKTMYNRSQKDYVAKRDALQRFNLLLAE